MSRRRVTARLSARPRISARCAVSPPLPTRTANVWFVWNQCLRHGASHLGAWEAPRAARSDLGARKGGGGERRRRRAARRALSQRAPRHERASGDPLDLHGGPPGLRDAATLLRRPVARTTGSVCAPACRGPDARSRSGRGGLLATVRDDTGAHARRSVTGRDAPPAWSATGTPGLRRTWSSPRVAPYCMRRLLGARATRRHAARA